MIWSSGSGGVGDAFARIAARRSFFERWWWPTTTWPGRSAPRCAGARRIRGSSPPGSTPLDRVGGRAVPRERHHPRAERRRPPLRDAGLRRRASPRRRLPRHGDEPVAAAPRAPYEQTGVKLGDEQFAAADDWEAAGRLALVGIGVEPGLSDIFARYAADHLFAEIDELGTRDGRTWSSTGYDFAPSFSIWTTIEECLNPPVIWERDRGWFTTAPFSEPEVFDFPRGHRPGRVRATSSTRRCC